MSTKDLGRSRAQLAGPHYELANRGGRAARGGVSAGPAGPRAGAASDLLDTADWAKRVSIGLYHSSAVRSTCRHYPEGPQPMSSSKHSKELRRLALSVLQPGFVGTEAPE